MKKVLLLMCGFVMFSCSDELEFVNGDTALESRSVF